MPRQGVSDAHTGPAVLGSLAYRMPWADRVTYSPADREVQRILLELLNQMDGFDTLHRVKMIMATNRPDTLDPALLRPGRLDR